MSWARWHHAETKLLYLVWQRWSQLPQKGPFEATHLACLVACDDLVLLPVLSTRALVKTLFIQSQGTTWPHLLRVPPFRVDVYCCSLLSKPHNERNATYGAAEITCLLTKGKQVWQNELCSGSHQGLFYLSWHTVLTSLVMCFLNIEQIESSKLKRRESTTIGKKSKNSEKCQLKARENNISYVLFNVSPNCPKYNWSHYRTIQ